jgi:hypothetical protein
MALVVTGDLASVLSAQNFAGRIQIDHWGIGVDPKAGTYVLNLFSQSVNYPEIVSDSSVAGYVALFALAKQQQVGIYYWPNGQSSVIYVGQFLA